MKVLVYQSVRYNSKMDYSCIICYELCRKPISCSQCHKLLCQQHVKRIQNRCPNCRLQPFEFVQEIALEEIIGIEIYRQKEKMKKESTFKCLVKGCDYSGKYPQMLVHRKAKHFDENIDEMIFPDERRNKEKRDIVKKLFWKPFVKKNQEYKAIAKKLYAEQRGKYELEKLMAMVGHLDLCPSEKCSMIQFKNKTAYIGDLSGVKSTCPRANKLEFHE